MSQYTKLQSVESGPFTPLQNRVSFRIPAGMNVDMNESHINLNTRILTTGGDPGSVASVRLRYKNVDGSNSPIAPIAAAMCKRTRLSCGTHGLLEDINRPDVFFCNMDTLNKSVDNHMNQLTHPIQVFDDTNQVESVYRELHKEGSIQSVESPAQYRLPLNQCLMLGSKTLNTTDLGECLVEVEMQVDRFIGEQILKSGDNFGNPYNKQFENFSGVGVFNTLTSKKVYDRLEDSPFFVGESLAISVGAQVGGIDPHAYDIISVIQWSQTTGKLTLTFTDPIATFTNALDSWTDITVNGRDVASADFLIDNAEIVLKMVDTAPPMKKLVYSTITTEIDNALSQTDFEKQYQTEANAYNLWVMTPSDVNDLSSSSRVVDYRIRSQNVDLTNRNVVVGSNTYLDQVGRSCKNTGRMFRNTNLTMPVCDSQSMNETMLLQQVKLLTTPLTITSTPKSLNLQVNSSVGGLKKVILFKEVMKSF